MTNKNKVAPNTTRKTYFFIEKTNINGGNKKSNVHRTFLSFFAPQTISNERKNTQSGEKNNFGVIVIRRASHRSLSRTIYIFTRLSCLPEYYFVSARSERPRRMNIIFRNTPNVLRKAVSIFLPLLFFPFFGSPLDIILIIISRFMRFALLLLIFYDYSNYYSHDNLFLSG